MKQKQISNWAFLRDACLACDLFVVAKIASSATAESLSYFVLPVCVMKVWAVLTVELLLYT